ncbi:hypothetical protein P170DRAFT_470209 [Aspergillus steynii IBT 23096]|uniref:Uncharacterized protein n=1 Tax=Aspergillus steynii IBT 23096 TaxID=1392250 RepID=A0A2I2GPG1_9EURO|nr:uncharacterized protein P170DRAFT_470209 [Aspergillus steynii IBT 23096]PLB54765.1 hypothetical protein P170DRAFT_470209 [Aspergillus steynii IBT 23096]
MDSTDSFLSSPKYGYDFVVSTTQASINSDLLLFLSESQQPVQFLCFLADEDGNPTNMISLEDLLKLTDNINPFEIPAGTDYNDKSIQALTAARFMVGIQIQIGLPPGVMPKNLPAIVDLGDDAKTVTFNMFCSQFTVIENTPGNGWTQGSWNVWSQPSGDPWYVQANVNLVMKSLNEELDTPYLNNHPELQAQLKAQLTNLSGTAFSLQQLLFDLENAVLQTVSRFEGIPAGSQAEGILQRLFVSIYSDITNDFGLPLVSVAVVATTPDPSQLQMTDFERQVSPLKDSNGAVIPSPNAPRTSLRFLQWNFQSHQQRFLRMTRP